MYVSDRYVLKNVYRTENLVDLKKNVVKGKTDLMKPKMKKFNQLVLQWEQQNPVIHPNYSGHDEYKNL